MIFEFWRRLQLDFLSNVPTTVLAHFYQLLVGIELYKTESKRRLSTPDKGSGVRAEELIGAGEFICEYAGECIGEEEVERRCKEFEGEDNYTLTLREHFGDRIVKTFIDPRLHGNIGRFLNHSCDPNCEIVIVRLGKMIPIAAIFAKRDIESGEELCYDYGVSGIEGPNRKPCHCKSATCRKYLPMSATPIE
ncbi:unnamed protein product [Caenorhabditis brenneri]